MAVVYEECMAIKALKVTNIYGASTVTPVTIGDASTTSHALASEDDLYVSGKLEVDGVTYFDGVVYYGSYASLLDNQSLYLGSATDTMILWNTGQTPDTLMLGLGSDSNGLVVTTKANTGYDFAHALQTNPTLFVHSAAQSTTQWTGITHNGTTGLISTGTGSLTITATGLSMNTGCTIRRCVTATITASTTQTQGQGALTSDVNEISVCANANDTVTLPTAVAGMMVTVINNGAQTARIYPASGDDLGAGVDTATTLAAAANATFCSYNATNWEVV